MPWLQEGCQDRLASSASMDGFVSQLFGSSLGQVKGKVKFTLGQATKARGGEYMYSSTLSLTSALDGGVWSKVRPGLFTPGKDPVPTV